MDGEDKQKEILISWKEIADYLDCKTRSCQRWEKEARLPVHRYSNSSKSRVFAYKEDISDWLEKKTLSEKKNIAKYFYFLIPIIGFVLIYIAFIFPHSPSQPHDFRIDGSDLVTLNQKNKEIWRYDTGIKGLNDEEHYRNHFQVKRRSKAIHAKNLPLIIIKDIDNNGKKEVLFAQKPIDYTVGEDRLFCFNSKGKIIWEFEPGREMRFGKKQYSSEYSIIGIYVVDMFEDNSPEIIVISYNIDMFPTQFAVLNNKGKLLREYWNSGRIIDYYFYDLDNDQKNEIILTGCNNEYGKGCLLVLDPGFISGGSPQTGYYKSTELKQNIEKYYILLPSIDLGSISIDRDPLGNIQIIDEKLISATSMSGICFEFDFNFKLKEIRFADTFKFLYNDAYKKGITKDKFSVKTMSELKTKLFPEILYYNGKNWSNTPLLAKTQKN